MSKIIVPKEMLEAAEHFDSCDQTEKVLEAALGWLSDNPMVPDDWQVGVLLQAKNQFIDHFHPSDWIRWGAVEWQRRMFLAPEPSIPEEIKDLWDASPTPDTKRRTIEAYRRGRTSR